jgi:hypothetical protein
MSGATKIRDQEWLVLERRTSAVGRDTISHPDRGHDDVANAVAGAAALSKFGGYDTSLLWVSGPDDDAAWQRARLQAYINSGGRIRLWRSFARSLTLRAGGILRQTPAFGKCSLSVSRDGDQLGEASLAVDQRQVA